MIWHGGGLTHRIMKDQQGNAILDNNGNKIYEETPWFVLAVPSATDRDRITARLAAETINQPVGGESPFGEPCQD
jgi:hypothetical protein